MPVRKKIIIGTIAAFCVFLAFISIRGLLFTFILGIYSLFPEPRQLDPVPVMTTSESIVPPGRAEVSFGTDTGGDQMGMTKLQNMILIVHYGNIIQEQSFVNCHSTDYSITNLPIEVECDHRTLRLVVDAGRVVINEMNGDAAVRILAEVKLPKDIHTVTYTGKDGQRADLPMTSHTK